MAADTVRISFTDGAERFSRSCSTESSTLSNSLRRNEARTAVTLGPLVVARGKGYEEIIVRDIEAAAKVPASTGVRAAMEALRHVGARRVAIASPYPERHNSAMAGYLAAFGFEIVRAEGMDVPFKALQSVTPAAIQAFATGVLERTGTCDALYLPCPQWQAAQVVDALEREHSVPAIAYTHASFFVAFKALGIKDTIRGHGRLLASLAEVTQ